MYHDSFSNRGFEVGIHDLHHDGKLYRSQQSFRRAAVRINHYLHEWNATGFRSGFMHHNLQWLHHLDIGYDMSTFDTDPFEPQPDGVHTIFPFWVQKPFDEKFRQDTSPSRTFSGYSELPYTLPQDSTLFLLLEHTSPHVWKTKLDWIAKHGGMALLNVHPDYLSFSGAGELGEYPAKMYSEFLEYVLTNYRNQFWFALPSEVAAYAREVVGLGTNFVSRSGDPREIRGKVPLVV